MIPQRRAAQCRAAVALRIAEYTRALNFIIVWLMPGEKQGREA